MNKRILVAPLDWGLGHATRCIPVIRELLKEDHQVLIAADGKIEKLLREEFPELQFVFLKGYRLSYSGILPAWLKVISLLPRIFHRMVMEHSQLNKLIRDHQIDMVLSDGRFGLWNSNVHSVYITHQLMIKCPDGLEIFEPMLHALHKMVIKKFDHCWVPDYAGTINLSGDLSHKYPLPKNALFISPLSRFSVPEKKEKEYDLCIMISGPEPSRSAFEKIILKELKEFSGSSILILGKPDEERDEMNGRIRIVSHLNSRELQKIIAASEFIVCRSGYSSIMDLVALQKSALLVPTPGQTEQEYLAEYLSEEKIFETVKQKDFTLKNIGGLKFKSIESSFPAESELSPLEKAISQLKDS